MWVNKKRKSKITKKKYDTICNFSIPIILTILLDWFNKFYNFILNKKGVNGYIFGEEFPWIKPIFWVILAFLYLVSFSLVLFIKDRIKSKCFDTPSEEKHMKDTFLRLKEFGSKRQDCFRTGTMSGALVSGYVEFLITSHKKSIDLVVSTCLEFFMNSFSEQGNLVNEISFEVSFMSKSFIDNKITIVSSDNSRHRTPPSMLNRNSKPDIYDGTETGKLYERYRANPSGALAIHIVEDSTQTEFTALYEGELESIRSMAILPILSPKNELLGTLVVCVNQANFFKNRERHFWNELLEIYSVELGYHYLALEYCISQNENILEDSFKKPF